MHDLEKSLHLSWLSPRAPEKRSAATSCHYLNFQYIICLSKTLKKSYNTRWCAPTDKGTESFMLCPLPAWNCPALTALLDVDGSSSLSQLPCPLLQQRTMHFPICFPINCLLSFGNRVLYPFNKGTYSLLMGMNSLYSIVTFCRKHFPHVFCPHHTSYPNV